MQSGVWLRDTDPIKLVDAWVRKRTDGVDTQGGTWPGTYLEPHHALVCQGGESASAKADLPKDELAIPRCDAWLRAGPLGAIGLFSPR